MANKKYEEADIQAIATTIREKTGTDKKYSTANMDEGVNEVYEAGENTGYDKGILAMWDAMTAKGARSTGRRVFNESDFTDIETLPYPFKPIDNIVQMFYNYRGRKLPRPQYIDLSLPSLPTNNNEDHCDGFCQWWAIPNIVTDGVFYDYGLPALNTYYGSFSYSSSLGTIEVLRCHENTKFPNTFYSTRNLVNITFEGVIGQDLNMSSCTKLSTDSQKNIITHLKNFTGLVDSSGATLEYKRTLTLSSVAFKELEAEGFTDADKEWLTSIGLTYSDDTIWTTVIDGLKWNLVLA